MHELHRTGLEGLLNIASVRLQEHMALTRELRRWLRYRTREMMEAESDGRVPPGTTEQIYAPYATVEVYMEALERSKA